MSGKNCASCYNPIRKNDNKASCDTCNAPLHQTCSININGTYCDACFTAGHVKREAVELELPSVIRRSNIERYRSCPFAFYLEVIKGHGNEQTIYTQLGVDLHDYFEKHARDNTFDQRQMIVEMSHIFRNYPPELFGDVDKDKMYERMIASINGFYKVAPTIPPHTLEETIEFPVADGLPIVSITMDRVDLIDGELELLDWKTGKVMVGKKLTTDMQAPLYIHAVKQHFSMPVRKFTYYYVGENKMRVFERETDDVYVCRVLNKEYRISITDTLREVNKIFSRIKNKEFNVNPDTRSMYFTCSVCSQKKNGRCRGADEEVWHQKEAWV